MSERESGALPHQSAPSLLAAVLRELGEAELMDGDTNSALVDVADRLDQCQAEASAILAAIDAAEAKLTVRHG